jgi:membrane associated rhomboid family serine protease
MFPVCDVIPSRRKPLVTTGLIIAIAMVFIYEQRLDRRELHDLASTFGVVPGQFSWTTLLTSVFLHDGWIHFVGNALYLWIFGENVEDALGRAPYLLLFFASGALAGLAYGSLAPSSVVPLVGASGAVAAVMGAHFALYRRSHVLTVVVLPFYVDIVEIPAVFFLGFWVLLQLLLPWALNDASLASLVVALAVGALAGIGAGGRRWDREESV